MVELINIYKKYPSKVIFNNFNYRFNNKGLYLINDVSGTGKTTLLNMIKGYDKDYLGIIKSDSDIFYLKINEGLILNLTVKENIELIKDIYGINRVKYKYGIDKLINKKVSKLSYGERQRVLIYLCLICKCKTILLDEPLAYLDNKNKAKVIKDLNKLAKKKLLIVVSHSLSGFCDYTKVNLNSSKLIESKIDNERIDKNKVNIFKWNKVLIRVNFKYLLLFILSVFIILNSYITINNKSSELMNNFNSSYKKGELYYKKNNTNIDLNFYKDVVSKLNKEIVTYNKNVYSIKMYESRVNLDKEYLGNGFLFAFKSKLINLNKDEVIVSIDVNKFCKNNNYSYCSFSMIKNRYLNKKLVYLDNDFKLEYKIKDIIEGSDYLYFSELDNLESKLINQYKDDYKIQYLITIDNSKIEDFYYKINHLDTLLNYDFIFIKEIENQSLFYVSESRHQYFSYDELKSNDLIACNKEIVNCSSFSLFELETLKYINDNRVNDKIYFSNIKDKLNKNEIIISSSLKDKYNLKINDKVSLKFVLNDSLYLMDCLIKGVIKDSKDCIYQNSEFSYLNFSNLVKEDYRIEYAYKDKELDYLSTDLLDYKTISSSKDFFNNFIKTIKVSLNILVIVILALIFYLEIKRSKKNYPFYSLLKHSNVVNTFSLIKSMYLIYFIISLFILILDYKFFILYFLVSLVFYFIYKIKIQVSLDL